METAVSERPTPSLEGAPTGEGLTFEKVWAMFQESDRKFQAMSQDTDRMIREMSQESDRMFRETKQLMKETERQMKETDRKIGELGNRFGELAEHLVAPAIYQRFNELGYHFEGIYSRGYGIPGDAGRIAGEVDILLESDNYIIAVEVKAKPHIKDIEHHIKRLEILRQYRSKHHDTRKIQGAIAGAIFPIAEKKAVIEAGFFVLEQSGDTVKMDVPDGFVPREW